VTGFGKKFWFLFIPTALALLLFIFLYRPLIAMIGMNATTAIWIGLVITIGGVFSVGLWKFAQVEAAKQDLHESTNPDV